MHELYRHLAACDLAVVQGGLTTSMELTANARPFLYFPLRHHFEQNFHVHHRLERYGAGRRMDFETDGPAEIAAAIAEEIGREVDYRAGRDRRRLACGRAHRRAAVVVPVVLRNVRRGVTVSRHPAEVRYLTFTQPYMSNSAKCGVKLHRTR